MLFDLNKLWKNHLNDQSKVFIITSFQLENLD